MILDTDKLAGDGAYREDMRHRFLTDHFFAAELLGFYDFSERAHRLAVNLYGPRNVNLSIREQPRKRKLLHLDPRHTFKTTLKRVDRIMWIAAFPEEMTILNQSATQPLSQAVSFKTAMAFYRAKGWPARALHLLFPEIVVDKYPEAVWNTPNRRQSGAGDLDATLAFTSPQSTQSGWHPLLLDNDDVEDTKNSGISASAEVRQGVVDICDQNENLIRDGGFVNTGGTRYHPLDYYGKCLERAKENPESWDVLVRCSLIPKDGRRLVPGDFPKEEDCELQFPEFKNLSYAELREKFYANYESFMCFRAGCRVLMADWTERPIEQVKIDDEVIGFAKIGKHNIGFQKTRVKKLFSRRAEVAKVTTNTGRVTYPTFDHRYLRPPNGVALSYVRLKVGSKMVSVYTPIQAPSEEQQRDLDWLGGMLDGEGSISSAGTGVYQKESMNPEVYAAIGEVLNRLGIDFGTGLTHSTQRFCLSGGRSLLIYLRQHARMYKTGRILDALFSSKQISETSGRGGGGTYPVVETMESIGEDIVYDFETETHNFVCDGFAVHNCQQQNDPQGGSVTKFDPKLYDSLQIEPGRIPRAGEVYIAWRPRYGGKPGMAKYSEGAAARIVDGKVYVLDAWQGTYAPSGEAEKIVFQAKAHDADGVMIVAVPGSEYVMSHVRNEASRRNRSVKLQWLEFEEDDSRRIAAIEQLEPLMKVGRVMFSTAMSKGNECRNQFIHFGLMEEQGIIEAISKFADLVPISAMRANMSEEEIEWQRRRRDDALLSAFLGQQGMPVVDETIRQKTEAHLAAMSKVSHFGLPPMPGGLDG